MRQIFSIDSKFMQILGTIADYMFLNVIFLVTCLPILTIGAAKTALYRVMFDMLEDKGGLYKKYFVTFKNELLTTMPLLVLKGGVSALLVWEMWVAAQNRIPFMKPVIVVLVIILFLWSLVFSSLFPQVAVFRSTRREYLRNSVFIALSQLWRCVIVGIFDIAPVFLLLWRPDFMGATGPFWFLLYFSVTVNTGARIFRKPFQKYIEQFNEEADS